MTELKDKWFNLFFALWATVVLVFYFYTVIWTRLLQK